MTTEMQEPNRTIAVLTSGGDAPGMNAAVRAVVRTALDRGRRGVRHLRGLPGHGRRRRPHPPDDLGRRSAASCSRAAPSSARRAPDASAPARAASRRPQNLVERGIDGLVVIGGDGSLTGANIFRQEWPELLAELVEAGESTAEAADRHPHLAHRRAWSARSTTTCTAPT